MGLQAWYPLINDMRNQGVGDTDLVVETTPTFGVGKIGNSLISGGNSHWTAAQSEKVLNNKAISICFWVYVDAPEGDKNKRAMFFGNDGKRNYSLFQYPSCNDFHWSWYSYDSSSTGTFITGGALSGALPSYKWTHVAITYDNPNGTIYINGENKRTFSGVMDNYTFSNQTQVIYQCEYRKLNDFRIYDHCLSPREVKEISKGLVLHYPLAMPGGNNIYINSDTVFNSNGSRLSSTTVYNGLIVDNNSPGGKYRSWDIVAENNANRGIYYTYPTSNGSLNLTENEIYTVSFYARCSKQKILIASSVAESQTILNYDGTSGNINISTTWGKHYVTFKYTQTSKITTCFYLWRLDENVTLDIALPKLELGDHPTPWLPNPADVEYSTLGFDDGIEYDVSGYERNGIKNNITNSSDTPRYNTSSIFDGSNSYISLSHPSFNPLLNGGTTPFTIAFWIYHADSTRGIIFGDYSLGGNNTNIELTTGHSIRFYWNGSPDMIFDGAVSLATWAHVALVYNGTNIYFYKNGILEDSRTVSLSTKSKVNGEYRIGRDARSDYTMFNGKLSDFCVYSTALSADDILELYNTPETLSHNGVLLTQGEYVES